MRRLARLAPGGWFGSVLVVASVLGIATFDLGSAAPTAQTVNVGNVVTAAAAAVILPPTDVNASLAAVVLAVPPHCMASVTWTASATPGVTAHEVKRVIAATGTIDGGPWTVPAPATSYFDSPVTLLAGLSTYEWQVRALVNGSPSDWAVATVVNPLLCSF